MSKQDKALVVIVVTALAVVGAAYLHRRDRQFVAIANTIDACDPEPTVERKTAALGRPTRDEREPERRELTWTRDRKALTVVFVKAPSRDGLVVGIVRVTGPEQDVSGDRQSVLYEDLSGLRYCKYR